MFIKKKVRSNSVVIIAFEKTFCIAWADMNSNETVYKKIQTKRSPIEKHKKTSNNLFRSCDEKRKTNRAFRRNRNLEGKDRSDRYLELGTGGQVQRLRNAGVEEIVFNSKRRKKIRF